MRGGAQSQRGVYPVGGLGPNLPFRAGGKRIKFKNRKGDGDKP